MTHTDRDEAIAQAIYDIISNNLVDLELEMVLYGNHTLIPANAVAVVSPQGKVRALVGVSQPGGRTENRLMVSIQLHWSRVGDEATERKRVDDRAYELEKLIHKDTTLNGIIIHGFISSVERGETTVSTGGMFRTVIMTYEGKTHTYLSPPAAPV